MKTEIVIKNCRLAATQKDYIEKKVNMLAKYLGNKVPEAVLKAHVVIVGAKHKSKEDAFEITVTINLKGKKLFADELAPSPESAIDLVIEKLKKQVTKIKAKADNRHEKRIELDRVLVDIEIEDDWGDLKIIKRQRYSDDDPITEEQAIRLLEKIEYDFLLFNNKNTGRHSVMYKREDGFYGVVEPKSPNVNLKKLKR